MRPSQIVLDNPPKEDQIFEGIPLHTVISYVYSQTERQIQSYMTPKGNYLLGQYGFPVKSLFSSCKKQQTDKMIVLKPVIFIANKSKKQQITVADTYRHVPFKTWLRRVDEVILLEQKEMIFSVKNNGIRKQQSFLCSNQTPVTVPSPNRSVPNFQIQSVESSEGSQRTGEIRVVKCPQEIEEPEVPLVYRNANRIFTEKNHQKVNQNWYI
ncbi:Hypothetical_protein [Hexamita inflata]|uniref:Hypothetical_protein n=1 Tax=Hexamita inflata TaxID=28002 RepID=A0AA86REB5_9EUKA|nr:Hypothetical protein HINF_LOCUS58434 [Hexamita inflata]